MVKTWSGYGHPIMNGIPPINGYTVPGIPVYQALQSPINSFMTIPSWRYIIQLFTMAQCICKEWASYCFNKRWGLVFTVISWIISRFHHGHRYQPVKIDRETLADLRQGPGVLGTWWNRVVMELWDTQIFADRNEDMHCTNINWDMTLVDSNAYDFPSPGIPMTNQTWFSMISLMWMILHSLICCGGVSCQCKTIANKHGKGFEEQGSSKENMLEKIEESRKTSLKIAGRPQEVYTAAWRFIWGEWCPAGSRGLFKQRGDAVWMVRDCESLSPRWRIHHVERWSWTTPYHPTLYMCPSTKALLSHQEPSQCSTLLYL